MLFEVLIQFRSGIFFIRRFKKGREQKAVRNKLSFANKFFTSYSKLCQIAIFYLFMLVENGRVVKTKYFKERH